MIWLHDASLRITMPVIKRTIVYERFSKKFDYLNAVYFWRSGGPPPLLGFRPPWRFLECKI